MVALSSPITKLTGVLHIVPHSLCQSGHVLMPTLPLGLPARAESYNRTMARLQAELEALRHEEARLLIASEIPQALREPLAHLHPVCLHPIADVGCYAA